MSKKESNPPPPVSFEDRPGPPRPPPPYKPARGTSPKIRFFMQAAEFDPSGYYYARWDTATPIELLARTSAEAVEKAKAILGEPRSGRCWTVRVDRISEELES